VRILVLSASVGSGHTRAAQAVEAALKDRAPKAEVVHVDVLGLTNAAFRRIYRSGYFKLIDLAPHVIGYLYERTDRSGGEMGDRLRRAVQRLNLSAMEDLLEDAPWDLVVHTHFLSAEIAASMKDKGLLEAPHAIVVTDYDAHRIWVQQPCELYVTATEEAASSLKRHGVPPSRIQVTGIPIDPIFTQKRRREACLKAHGLSGDRPVVLQLAGGAGIGPLEEVYRGLLAVETPIEVVAVTGRNAEARTKLENVAVPERHRAHVIGFTDKMHELMAAADLIVTKPGGLTVSEALASGSPIVVIQPIPGQESRNSDYLLENGAGIKVHALDTLTRKVGELLASPTRLAALRRNAKKLGRPNAAFDAAQAALDLIAVPQL
jgi:processive 1,2-diacylglycerol beta-glucosyltransferase